MSWQASNDFGNSDIGSVGKTTAWARLYGGAGLIVNTAQDFRLPLDPTKISKDTPLEFIDADRWELIMSQTNIWDDKNPTPFCYYGLPLHKSRVVKVLGTEAPSYIRIRLQGWGMSAIESCVRSLQAQIKFEELVFELLDEAKIDVYKILGFTASLMSADGLERAKARILQGNRLKNYHNAVVMDKEDDYDQKQLGTIFSGLSTLWEQLRFNICADTGFPMEVLFGVPSTGFSGGEGSIKSYNRLIEATRCDEIEPLLCEVVDLRCMQMFGFIPDYTIEWPELAEIPATEQEQVKTAKQTRVMERFDRGLETGYEAMQDLDKDNVMDMETEVGRGDRDAEPLAMQQLAAADAEADSQESSNRPKPRATD
ncbi:MAG: anti-CBASS Acb1 family protein [Polyangia bacterium]